MGEAKIREDKATNGIIEQAKQEASGQAVQLSSDKAAVLFAVQRLVNAMLVESKQLAEVYNQREAAAEIGSSVEHLNKFAARFIADSQRSIIIPTAKVVLK